MKLTVINGSPRGKSSNTRILVDRMLDGFRSVESGYSIEVIYLKGRKNHDAGVAALRTSDIAIIAFPLYTDCMPGIVKEFIETIDPTHFDNPDLKLGFLVQSGFPEGHHAVYISRYLEKLTRRLGARYLGTVVKGGVEGIQIQPGWMKRFLDQFYDLGQYLAMRMEFNAEIMERLANPEHLSWFMRQFYRALKATGLSNYYWNSQLKQNRAYSERFAQPYVEQ